MAAVNHREHVVLSLDGRVGVAQVNPVAPLADDPFDDHFRPMGIRFDGADWAFGDRDRMRLATARFSLTRYSLCLSYRPHEAVTWSSVASRSSENDIPSDEGKIALDSEADCSTGPSSLLSGKLGNGEQGRVFFGRRLM